jgi:hypothetical protein
MRAIFTTQELLSEIGSLAIRKLHALPIAVLLFLPGAVAAQERPQELMRGGADFPKDPRALRLIEQELQIGNLGPIPPIIIPARPRYLVTYMNSQTGGRTRSATVVTVTNQSSSSCRVAVSYFLGFSSNANPVCSTSFAITPDFTIDFCSRNLPGEVTVCNSICAPELTLDEGRAIVSSTCKEIGVSSRVYYTSGNNDEQITGVTDSKIVRFGQGNNGD